MKNELSAAGTSKRALRFFAAFALTALVFGACDDSEQGDDDDDDDSTTTSSGTSGGGGSQATPCSGSDLTICLGRCDTLNDLDCADAAVQQTCRDKCNAATLTACVDYAACDTADCDARLDCWNVFSNTSAGGANCATACVNVVAHCGGDGGIDIATCTSLCANYSQTQIDCAANASNCQAVEACVGGFPS